MNTVSMDRTLSPLENVSSQRFLFLSASIAALGGFLFGYDTAVISGAIGPMRDYFGLSSVQVGWAISSALLGCVLGSLLAGPLSFKFGRKNTLIISSIIFTVTGFGTAYPGSFFGFILFRIFGGVGIGIASLVTPMYIAEISPSSIRGKTVSLNQFAIVSGIFVVYFVNYLIASSGDVQWNREVGWRYMLLSEVVPSLFFLFCLFLVPESPRWLVMKKRIFEATWVLKKVLGNTKEAEETLAEIKGSFEKEASEKTNWSLIFKPIYMRMILVGMLLSAFQQVSGINAFMYYAPQIFASLGHGFESSMLQTIFLGITNFVFTIIAMFGADRWGRKPILIWGSLVAGTCLVLAGCGMYFQSLGMWSVFLILGFIAAFAVSLGPIVWVLLAEMFPNNIRTQALSLAVAVQWIANFLVSQTFPMLAENKNLLDQFHGAFPFWLYGSMCFLCIFFVMKYIPETRGVSLEDVERQWVSKK